MQVKNGSTYYQDRRKEGLEPILLKVLKVQEVVCGHEICKVRWHILSKDRVHTSVFPRPMGMRLRPALPTDFHSYGTSYFIFLCYL